MKSGRSFVLVLAGTMIALSSCSPALPQPGAWSASPESFGRIDLVVNDESTAIKLTGVNLNSGWSCGEIGAVDLIAIGNLDDVYYPITEDSFVIQSDFVVGPNVYLLNITTLIITGSFNKANKASGTWEFAHHNEEMGENCTGTWEAEPIPSP